MTTPKRQAAVEPATASLSPKDVGEPKIDGTRLDLAVGRELMLRMWAFQMELRQERLDLAIDQIHEREGTWKRSHARRSPTRPWHAHPERRRARHLPGPSESRENEPLGELSQ